MYVRNRKSFRFQSSPNRPTTSLAHLVWYGVTQVALQLHQERTQVVRSNREGTSPSGDSLFVLSVTNERYFKVALVMGREGVHIPLGPQYPRNVTIIQDPHQWGQTNFGCPDSDLTGSARALVVNGVSCVSIRRGRVWGGVRDRCHGSQRRNWGGGWGSSHPRFFKATST